MTSIFQKCGWAGITAMITVAAFIFSYLVDIKKEKCPYLPPDVHTHQESYIPSLNRIVENNTATIVSHPLHSYSMFHYR